MSPEQKYRVEHEAWVQLSFGPSGRFNLVTATLSIQREGDLDILLRCLEDEFDMNKAFGVDFSYHYRLMFSETWIVGSYEILRASQQRGRLPMPADRLPVCPGCTSSNRYPRLLTTYHNHTVQFDSLGPARDIADVLAMRAPLCYRSAAQPPLGG